MAFPGTGVACPTTKECMDQILCDKDQKMQHIGCVGPMLLQAPLDETYVEASILHRLQHSCHQPQQTQELVSWLYAPTLEKDLTQAVITWICISGR